MEDVLEACLAESVAHPSVRLSRVRVVPGGAAAGLANKLMHTFLYNKFDGSVTSLLFPRAHSKRHNF